MVQSPSIALHSIKQNAIRQRQILNHKNFSSVIEKLTQAIKIGDLSYDYQVLLHTLLGNQKGPLN